MTWTFNDLPGYAVPEISYRSNQPHSFKENLLSQEVGIQTGEREGRETLSIIILDYYENMLISIPAITHHPHLMRYCFVCYSTVLFCGTVCDL
jgi:hypothetical protein